MLHLRILLIVYSNKENEMKSFKERWQELSLKNKIFSIIIFLGVCVMIVLTVLPSKEKESVEDEIKRKNKELGLLTVMEVVSKDCIYLKIR